MPRLWRKRGAALGLLLAAGISTPPAAAGTVVALHDRGRRLRFEGERAEEIARLCEAIVRRSYAGGGEMPSAELVRSLRRNEVAVEIRFDEPRRLETGESGRAQRSQFLLVPLSGPFTGAGGTQATVFAGHRPRIGEPAPPEWQSGPLPDEFGIQYVAVLHARDALEPLRQAVARLAAE